MNNAQAHQDTRDSRHGAFRQAGDAVGKVWQVVIIRAGLSENGVFYPDAVLLSAAPLFEGARVYARSDAEHTKGGSPDVGKLAGWLSDVTFVPGVARDTGHLAGVLNFTGQSELRNTITDAWQRGKTDLVALSIDAHGKANPLSPPVEGMKRLALTIDKVNSVDLIVHPGAGGRLIRLIESAPASGASGDSPPRRPCLADELLDRFFNARNVMLSFRECYVAITGDTRVTGRPKDCKPGVLREALDTNALSDVLAAAMRRRMVREYANRMETWGVWRKLVHIGRLEDFRTQTRVRFGGYGELAPVAQGAAYQPMAAPPTETASYALSKRGGLETVTLEAIKNDDIDAIRKVPLRLAETAHRTLGHFALDFLRTNPTIYDGVALFHASHGNLGVGALAASTLNGARTALRRQTALGSGDRLRTKPRYLVVPLDLEETAVNLFQRGDNNDKTFVQDLNLEVLPIWYWTDTNDWCVAADPSELPSIEVGFPDGLDEPELFTQDMPSAGSMFSNDQLTFKIRHIYGGAVVDFRGLYKAVVT